MDDNIVITFPLHGHTYTAEVGIDRGDFTYHIPPDGGPMTFDWCGVHAEVTGPIGEAKVLGVREGVRECPEEVRMLVEHHLRTVFPPGAIMCLHCFWDRIDTLEAGA